MDSIFMNSENSEASGSFGLILNLAGKAIFKKTDKYVAFSNLSVYYIWKKKKKWSDKFELHDGSYSVLDIQDYC